MTKLSPTQRKACELIELVGGYVRLNEYYSWSGGATVVLAVKPTEWKRHEGFRTYVTHERHYIIDASTISALIRAGRLTPPNGNGWCQLVAETEPESEKSLNAER